ncbi:hypothetical protein CEXT_58401, partial [Caerostris extrusa]
KNPQSEVRRGTRAALNAAKHGFGVSLIAGGTAQRHPAGGVSLFSHSDTDSSGRPQNFAGLPLRELCSNLIGGVGFSSHQPNG